MVARVRFAITVLLLAGATVAAGEWTTPVPVSEINTDFQEYTPFMSYDGLSLYFARGDTDTYYDWRIFEARRETPSGPFTSVQQALVGDSHVLSPWVSPDNLRLYYHEETSQWKIKMSERASVDDPWPQGTAIDLGFGSGPSFFSLSADELTIAFTIASVGNWDMYISARPDRDSPFGVPRNLAELNTASIDADPFLAPDALSIYFHSNRNGPQQLYKATRGSLSDTFGNLEHLSFFDTPGGYALWPALSSDGAAMYFGSGLVGTDGNIYVSYYVPEPGTIMLVGIGGLLLRKRR